MNLKTMEASSDLENVNKRRRFRWPLRIIIALIVISLLALLGIYQLNKPCDRTDATYKNIVIEEGASRSDVAKKLAKEGIVRKASSFELLSKITFSGNFRSGMYFLSPSMDSISIIKTLQNGLTTQTGFTIPPGYTVDQIATALDRDGLADKAAFLEAVSSPDLSEMEVLTDPTGELSGSDLVEGFLFPSEYNLSTDADESMMVIMMIDAFANFYNDEYQARADELGLTPREVLIIASMIEKETTVEKEKAAISAVIHNRYNLELAGEDEIPKVPLCSPSKESIIAALYPEEAEYTHYVLSSKLDGTHKFTSDDAEYEKLKAEYEAAVKERDEKKAAEKATEEIGDSTEGGN